MNLFFPQRTLKAQSPKHQTFLWKIKNSVNQPAVSKYTKMWYKPSEFFTFGWRNTSFRHSLKHVICMAHRRTQHSWAVKTEWSQQRVSIGQRNEVHACAQVKPAWTLRGQDGAWAGHPTVPGTFRRLLARGLFTHPVASLGGVSRAFWRSGSVTLSPGSRWRRSPWERRDWETPAHLPGPPEEPTARHQDGFLRLVVLARARIREELQLLRLSSHFSI